MSILSCSAMLALSFLLLWCRCKGVWLPLTLVADLGFVLIRLLVPVSGMQELWNQVGFRWNFKERPGWLFKRLLREDCMKLRMQPKQRWNTGKLVTQRMWNVPIGKLLVVSAASPRERPCGLQLAKPKPSETHNIKPCAPDARHSINSYRNCRTKCCAPELHSWFGPNLFFFLIPTF